MAISISNWLELDAEQRTALLQRPAVSADAGVREAATRIIERVRVEGDDAVRALTRELDGPDIRVLQVSREEIKAAERELTSDQIAAIDLAIANVRVFHEAQLPAQISLDTMPGVSCERISQPLDAVGLYVPAGTAPLPSAAIMLAVPATIADCPVRVLCTPPRPDGNADPAVVVAATRAGVETIFKIGGAQAIAAMAYGTETVPRVCKIFGPGNAWVTSAKTLVSTDAGGAAIDLPAGPSEVLVIADATANPSFVAADLLSQAEHGEDSQVVLVATSEEFVRQVLDCVDAQLQTLSRADIASLALSNSRAIVVPDLASAATVSNTYAPEHLILQVESPRDLLARIRNAGSVFLGPWTPESVGDYCSGTNHVLPTYGFARSYSGLGVDQFLRQMTVQEVTRDGLKALGGAVTTLAGLEGLDGHAAAVALRLGDSL